MSETTAKREWHFYLDDMIGFCERVQEFTRGLEQVRMSAPSIPWRMVIATRNRLIHGYLGIDNDTLWSIVETDVPALIVGLRSLRASLS